jgi:glycosyltransferase involved in cell wall biosynthesis
MRRIEAEAANTMNPAWERALSRGVGLSADTRRRKILRSPIRILSSALLRVLSERLHIPIGARAATFWGDVMSVWFPDEISKLVSHSCDVNWPPEIPGGAPSNCRDLVFVSMEHWDDVWRRNQFLCAGYAQRHPQCKVLFVVPPMDVTNAIRRGRWSASGGPRTWTVPQYPNITVTQPVKLAPNTFAAGRRINEALARAHVSAVARRLDIRHAVLWLNPHWAGHMAGRMGERAVIYDITDDWTALTQGETAGQLVRTQDEHLCRRADAVIVCSRRLFELKSRTARRLHLIPNGVDAGHYRTVLEDRGPLPEKTAHWPRPILGYTGTIHPDRVDIDLLASLAKNWKGSIVLIGPSELPAAGKARLDFANLFLAGTIAYSQLPSYMRAFDVCIVPHRVTPFTESLNPIKLWEYLAAGKPIVSTDVAGFRDYPQFVRIARDAGEFARAANDALSEDTAMSGLRQAEARKHSWQARLDQVEDVIAECLEQRG